jgi:hypothetical protein|tara:strand:+ start:1286 stop:1519 length:234 start_codon:yes stop_codon:yes gene_type:complete
MNTKNVSKTIMLFLVLFFFLHKNGDAALCAFRNPDRDVYILFPEATGYRMVIKLLDAEAKKNVEEFLGQQLDYGEGG